MYSEDSGKILTVVMSPEYSTVQGIDVTFYYGSKIKIWLHDVIRQLGGYDPTEELTAQPVGMSPELCGDIFDV